MMTFRWSWIFILYSLLVRLGSATVPDDDRIVNDIHQRTGDYTSRKRFFGFLSPDPPPKKPNVAAIVCGVIGGVALILAVIGLWFLARRRKVPHVEEGPKSPGALKERPDGLIPDLRSQFSPDEGSGGKFDRLRMALGRRRNNPSILPIFQIAIPPGSQESIDRPPPAVPSHVPKYPSVLERGHAKRRPMPPPLEGYGESRPPSTDTTRSDDSGGGERSGRRKVQEPPKALIVPTPGRPLPGLGATAKSAGLRPPKSPSRRRSWFSKHPLKHPFIPVRNADPSLRFPPGSPLHPGQYQPSRQHLEARARSPRVEAVTPRTATASAKPLPSARRQLAFLEQDPGSSKQVRLMEALQSASTENPRTPTQNGPRTAIPPNSGGHPLGSSRALPEPPPTSYI
ncbi:hypothetical protein LshimejAT787_0104290 [Lyophyllum shimeji]|uniref:Uncharacterized protein n=1 Tax=Lyophyllum shimeji TaxID=47721 RepID=A0A9P3PCJ9_LYOSH|nr:hypothetical protein LshimejAT787_0104290 [Lyophyllum shimeji]